MIFILLVSYQYQYQYSTYYNFINFINLLFIILYEINVTYCLITLRFENLYYSSFLMLKIVCK